MPSAVVESVKAASDIYAPVSGEISSKPTRHSPKIRRCSITDPYGAGWIFKIRIADSSELDGLLDAAAYRAQICEMSAVPFVRRHIGPSPEDIEEMVRRCRGPDHSTISSIKRFRRSIRLRHALNLPRGALGGGRAEISCARSWIRTKCRQSFIGMGYANCHVPAVIRRNILENPGWYTAYTPYQAEIAQGRLEALLNFQTMVCDSDRRWKFPMPPCSMNRPPLRKPWPWRTPSRAVAPSLSPTIAIRKRLPSLRTRAIPLGIRLIVGPIWDFTSETVFGALIQYPATDGVIHDLGPIIDLVHAADALAIVAVDLLALTLIKPPGEYGSDIVVGSAQRFGVSLGYGGPHAAFLATRDEYKRRMPGRLVGVSRDAEGRLALRLALQTREQHIRREKATSNICTAQVLLAVMASMYAVYHGPQGLKSIATGVHRLTCQLAGALKERDWAVHPGPFFDTIRIWLAGDRADHLLDRATAYGINLRKIDDHAISLTLDETIQDISVLLPVFDLDPAAISAEPVEVIGSGLKRESEFLEPPCL